MGAIIRAFGRGSERTGSRSVPGQVDTPLLDRGWIIANHKDQEILIIGDDLITTKDSTIQRCAEQGLINTALIKANQIGTLSETLLATRIGEAVGPRLGGLS